MNRLKEFPPEVKLLWEKALKDKLVEIQMPKVELPKLPQLGDESEFNWIITGKVGAGKSSLINSFCGKYLAAKRPEEAEAGPAVGVSYLSSNVLVL